MTNRKDMIDDALLRPGRLEVQVEIGLPKEDGRLEILNIHTGTMRKNEKLAADVDLLELSKVTKNFSGAEIEGLVRAAQSCALNRLVRASSKVSELLYSRRRVLTFYKNVFDILFDQFIYSNVQKCSVKKIEGANDLSSGQGLGRIFTSHFRLIIFSFLITVVLTIKCTGTNFKEFGEVAKLPTAAAGSNPESPI